MLMMIIIIQIICIVNVSVCFIFAGIAFASLPIHLLAHLNRLQKKICFLLPLEGAKIQPQLKHFPRSNVLFTIAVFCLKFCVFNFKYKAFVAFPCCRGTL